LTELLVILLDGAVGNKTHRKISLEKKTNGILMLGVNLGRIGIGMMTWTPSGQSAVREGKYRGVTIGIDEVVDLCCVGRLKTKNFERQDCWVSGVEWLGEDDELKVIISCKDWNVVGLQVGDSGGFGGRKVGGGLSLGVLDISTDNARRNDGGYYYEHTGEIATDIEAV